MLKDVEFFLGGPGEPFDEIGFFGFFPGNDLKQCFHYQYFIRFSGWKEHHPVFIADQFRILERTMKYSPLSLSVRTS